MPDPPPVAPSSLSGWHRQRGPEPVEIVRGEGVHFWDAAGNRYLDFASQLVAVNLGHANPVVGAAIARQAAELPYVAPGFSTPVRRRAVERIAGVLPARLRRMFFAPTGTEANEAALRIARTVTGRSKVVALEHSYHGATAASLSVSGDPRRRLAGSSGSVPGTEFAPNCYCYRCPLKLTYPSCGVACADEIDRAIDRSGGEVAAVILEPVVGTNGVIVPVPEYLPKVGAIARERGALLIADEVMTGWGRTGAWFATDRLGGDPDILTTAKGITGAHLPLGLTATTEAVGKTFETHALPVGHTYEAHPVALAAAEAAIGEYERLGLIERSKKEGEYLLARLRELAGRHPAVGEARGLGLFAGIELVRDATTRRPMNSPDDWLAGRPLVVDEVLRALAERGVYAMGWVSTLILAPPLIIERAEIDEGLAAVDAALARADAHVDP